MTKKNENNYLVHHGIPGQKWGVQNGPPYPLSHKNIKYYGLKFKQSKGKSLTAFTNEARKQARLVNPEYDLHNPGAERNCVYCSLAYELRRRGMDVSAVLSEKGASIDTGMKEIFKNFSEVKYIIDVPDSKEEKDKLDKLALSLEGNKELLNKTIQVLRDEQDSRGQLFVEWPNNAGGHALNYEVHKGKVIIIDPQPGIVYEYPNTLEGIRHASFIRYRRLDNLEIDTEKYEQNKNHVVVENDKRK